MARASPWYTTQKGDGRGFKSRPRLPRKRESPSLVNGAGLRLLTLGGFPKGFVGSNPTSRTNVLA